ncbi:MAG: hypothetical protein D6722_04730 [Bacteroidetes bacterium]|nr:MAG: hypothetical protein D6722_04730 [Bacteroidota bacterium]
MKRLFSWLILLFPLLIQASPAVLPSHPIYVSVCEIDYNPETQHLEVALRMFIDDIEAAMEAEGLSNLRIGSPAEAPEAPQYLERYLRQHLRFAAGGAALPMDFLGTSVNQDVIWCYFEVKGLPPAPGTIKLTNTILLDWLEEQKNIVYFRSQGAQTNLLLRHGKSEAIVSY